MYGKILKCLLIKYLVIQYSVNNNLKVNAKLKKNLIKTIKKMVLYFI